MACSRVQLNKHAYMEPTRAVLRLLKGFCSPNSTTPPIYYRLQSTNSWAASLLSMASSFLTVPKPILFKTNAPSLPNSNQRPLLGTKFYSLYELTFNPFCFYINKHFLSRILFEWFFVSGSWTGLRRNSLRVNAISKKWEPTKVFCFFFFS